MLTSKKSLGILAAGSAFLWTTPSTAQGLPEPVRQAEPIEVAEWQNRVARDIPGIVRFEGLPELRFGFLVDTSGRVRTCLALPLEGETYARGQNLCPAFEEHARFRPALDTDGNPVESVFVAHFGNTRPSVAIDHAGVPNN